MTTPAPQSLVAGSRRLLALLPTTTRRSLGLAGILAFLLAGLEFLALLLLYPVFGVLSQPGSPDAPVSLFGVLFDRSWTRYLAMAALGLLVLRSILTLAYRRWWLGVAARAELRLSERLLRGFAYAPYRFHLSTVTTDLATQAVSHVGLACQTGLNGLVGVFSATLLSVGLGAALIVTNPLAGVAVTVYLTILGLLYSLRTREWNHRLGAQLQSHIRLVYGRTHVLLRGIRELTIFGQRDDQLAQISAARARMVRTNMQVFLLQDIPKAALEVTLYTTVLVALSFMLSMSNPDDALPLVALYVVAGLRLMPALAQLLGYVSSARTGLKVAGSVADTIDELEATGAAPDAADGPDYPARADLTIRDLTFRYEADLPPVIDRLSLRLPHGTFLGVVGPSGSGKTTFTSLVLGLLAPQQGAISYGGQPVVANDTRWFHKVAVVPQEVFLTDDSLRDNIRAGLPDDAGRMAQVVASADLEPLVADLPQGLDTRLGEAGSRLSAGQRQRVGLARALYHDPEILVLDEPTSALDAATEARIVASLERLRGTRTIIAVAHRTATLTGSDQVLRLGADGAATVGAPATLLAGEPRA